MTIRAKKFGPERMLSAPRRSAAIPSPDGKLAVYSCQTYSFASHTKTNEICVLDITTGESSVICSDAKVSEPRWLRDEHQLVWLKEGDNGNTSVVIADATTAGKSYVAGTISGPVSSLKVHYVKEGMTAIAVAGQANSDGGLHNPKDEPNTRSTARLYDELFVRHWDTYTTKQRGTIFTALLQKAPARVTDRQGRYNLMGFTNALKGTGLESPVPPFGGTEHFDIGDKGLVLVAKDPNLDPATHTKCNVYFIPREDLMDVTIREPVQLVAPGLDGAAACPIFSRDSQSVAWLQMRQDGYESDRNLVVVYGLSHHDSARVVVAVDESGTEWDHSPNALTWSNDATKLYVQAEDNGAGCLFELDLRRYRPNFRQLTQTEYVIDVTPASIISDDLFVSANSLVDSSFYFILSPNTPQTQRLVSTVTDSGKAFGLSKQQVKSLWWKGDNGHPVHAWMMVPSWFNAEHKYPLAYLVHGGPQGAWNDQWSTRWNPAIFAEQGYVVICPNPTGSTGYGQAFTDAIRGNWGGSPYIDLEKGFEYISQELSFVDTNRAVALGASYGGYMMNWIQGHPLGQKFQALVCHDGVFSMTSQLASDELYFPVHDLGGRLWDNQELWEKWDPSRFLKNWSTPMLVIHSELDYRLTVAEGLAAFNVLQMKGVRSRFLNFPDENHWVLKHENSLVWHLVVLNWINSFVGLPEVVDQDGRNGSEYTRNGKHCSS